MSSDVRLDISGMERVLREQPEQCDRWLAGFAEDMVTRMKTSMGSGPPGLSYQRGGVTHVASSPGYPPNVDVGNLINSLQQVPDGYLRRRLEDGTSHGIHLEDGTDWMAPRPFFRPVFDEAGQRIERDAAQNLRIGE